MIEEKIKQEGNINPMPWRGGMILPSLVLYGVLRGGYMRTVKPVTVCTSDPAFCSSWLVGRRVGSVFFMPRASYFDPA